VNQSNVLVGNDSKVMLIDCDSFQIHANKEMHLCEGGVSHFTPPELQGLPSFHAIKRTSNHDNFGLALLIFHLLFGGRHPFSGVPLRKDVGDALETDIQAFRFAYARDAQSRGIGPPPQSIPLSLVPDAIEAMFYIAFTERGASGGRPSAQEWNLALDALRRGLKRCGSTSMHIYPDHLGQCPWCALENKGVIYFIDLGFTFTSTASGFVLSKLWAVIEAVPAPLPVVIPNITSFSVSPRPLPPGVSGKWMIFFLRLLVVSSTIGLLVEVPGAWFFIVIGAWLAWYAVGSFGESERNEERNRRNAALEKARREYQAEENRIRNESGPEGFAAKKQELVGLRSEYESLPATEKSEKKRLHATAEARQKQQFLDRCFIDSANISGVGPAKKATLRSFGIETAADADSRRVRSVRGFGEVLTRAVVDWRKSCERQFVFNPRNAVSDTDKNAVRTKIETRTRVIEEALKSGAADLQRFQREADTKRNALYPLLSSVAKNLAQAQADLTLL
jgi:DNA-binding helix-hairpin-helix protein with protein kinase domain